MTSINLDLPRGAIAIHVAVAGLAAVGVLSLLPPSGGRVQAMLLVPILTALLAVILVLRTKQTVDLAREEAESATANDTTTGVANAQTGEEVLRMEFAAAQRDQDRALTIALIRIEDLRRYQATHGQAVTDRLLRECGLVLGKHRRGMHLTARSAKDPSTFVSILSGVDRHGATIYATRLRRDLLAIRSAPRPPGVSVGIAAFDLSMTSAKDMVRKAAFALKKGAAAGGKIVVVGGTAAALARE